jgi:DNA-binding CsgD family transcriptional regulator
MAAAPDGRLRLDVLDALTRGRESYGRRAWAEAYESLSLADRAAPLGAEDLERLATSAYLTGRDDDFGRTLERAHRAYLNACQGVRAARCAFWLGLSLLLRGETGRATGWLARTRRLLGNQDCAEQGYLLLPVAEQRLADGDGEAAHATASTAASIGDRFGETDLTACARHLQGRALMQQGQMRAGLALLDEAMVAATAGELSPIMTGLIYCSVIDVCQQAYALDRAREWTAAMTHWCEQQPEMVAFTATCLVHRAEIMQLHGAWREAIEEARRACQRASQGSDQTPPAAAFYQQAEVHRLRGEFRAAEEGYRRASQAGWEPQPGLALLRMGQGRVAAAAIAIRRVLSATTNRLQRTKLLPAYVEIMLAVGDVEEARAVCHELEEIAGRMCQQLKVPYLAARARLLMGLACRVLGDDEGGALELDAARVAFEALGAAPDLARMNSLTRRPPPGHPRPLTPRELQVLRMIATGKTKKAIAAALSLSQKTIDRHVSNIFTKLDVPSRAAATAYAYEHRLM